MVNGTGTRAHGHTLAGARPIPLVLPSPWHERRRGWHGYTLRAARDGKGFTLHGVVQSGTVPPERRGKCSATGGHPGGGCYCLAQPAQPAHIHRITFRHGRDHGAPPSCLSSPPELLSAPGFSGHLTQSSSDGHSRGISFELRHFERPVECRGGPNRSKSASRRTEQSGGSSVPCP